MNFQFNTYNKFLLATKAQRQEETQKNLFVCLRVFVPLWQNHLPRALVPWFHLNLDLCLRFFRGSTGGL